MLQVRPQGPWAPCDDIQATAGRKRESPVTWQRRPLSRRVWRASKLPGRRREAAGAGPEGGYLKCWGIWGPWVWGWQILEWKTSGSPNVCMQGWGVGAKDSGRRAQAGPEALALSQGLLLLLLLSVAGVWAPRGPLRPLCRPINATLAAENEACPVCITFTTSICAGYCPSMVSCPGWVGAATSAPGGLLRARPAEDRKWPRGWKGGPPPGAGAGHVGEHRWSSGPPSLGSVGCSGGARGRAWPQVDTQAPPPNPATSRFGCCRLPCRLCPSQCAPTASCALPPSGSPAARLVWTQWSPFPWPSAVTAGPAASAALTVGVPEPSPWPVTAPLAQASSSSKDPHLNLPCPPQPPMPTPTPGASRRSSPSLLIKTSQTALWGCLSGVSGCVCLCTCTRTHNTHNRSSFRTILYKVTVSELW